MAWVERNGFSYHIPLSLPAVTITVAYLFYEKRDIPFKLLEQKQTASKNIAIIIVGYCPNAEIIFAIATYFSNARFRAAFGRDLTAIVLACRVSLWLEHSDCEFWLASRRVYFRYRHKTFSCPEEIFPLSRFCKISGFRTQVNIFL